MADTTGRQRPHDREKMFNAPLLPLLLAISMPTLFFFQQGLEDGGLRYALRPAALFDGGWSTLVTSMLLHAGWLHAGMNALGALAFGAPVARLLPGVPGAIAFIAFYIACGVVGGLGFALVHPDSFTPVIGASGGVFGLIGASVRLLGGEGGLLALTDRRVISSSIAWMAINAFTGLIGFVPGVEGGMIAWEAHAFGFLAGILLIGPVARLFGRKPSSFDSSPGLGNPLP